MRKENKIISAGMLPPWTDFIIAYMDSLPLLAGSETGDSWSQRDSLEQDFTRQGRGEGMRSGLNGLNFEKSFTELEGWPLLFIGVPGGPATCHNEKQYCQQMSLA